MRKIFDTDALTSDLAKIRIEENNTFQKKIIFSAEIDNQPTLGAVLKLDLLLITWERESDANEVKTQEAGGNN